MSRQTLLRMGAAAAVAAAMTSARLAAQGAPEAQAPAAQALPLTLEDAVERAIEHNPDLAIVRVAVDVEGARVQASRSAFEPVFSTVLGRSNTAAPPSASFLGTDAIDTSEWFSSVGVRQRLSRGGGTWHISWDGSRIGSNNPVSSFDPILQSGLQFAFSQPLFRDRETDAARHQVIITQRNHQRSELQLRESVVQTVAAVKQAYWTLKAARANVTVQQRSLELAEDLVRQNRARVDVGQAPPLDLVQAESEVAQRREALIRAQAAARDAEDRLRRLIMDPGDAGFWNVQLDPVEEPGESTPPPNVDEAVARAMRERYDLVSARYELENAASTVQFLNNQKLPDIRLEASYRTGGVGGTQLLRSGGFPGDIIGRNRRSFGDALGQLFTDDFPTWSFGVTVSYPIGRSFEEASLARAELQRQQVAHRIASLQLQIAEGIRQAARQVQSTAERVEAARAGRTLAEQRYDVERQRFEAGLSTSFLVTQAQRDLLQAEVNLLQASLDHQSARIQFESVQLAAPPSAGESIGLQGAEVVYVPTPAPQGIFSQRTGAF